MSQMNCVFKIHVLDVNGNGHSSPCVFSSEKLAMKWARKYSTRPSDWSIERILVDNWSVDAVSTNR